MDGPADLDDADRDALERAMEIARHDPLRAEQLQSMLADEPWVDVASFASYSCQIESLSLKPWQSPPVHVDQNDPDEQDKNAQRLLRRMLTVGISRFDPDPLAALQRANKRQTLAARKNRKG